MYTTEEFRNLKIDPSTNIKAVKQLSLRLEQVAAKINEARKLKDHGLTYASPTYSSLKRWVISTVERWTGLTTIQKIYRDVRKENATPYNVCGRGLEKLDIKIDVDQSQLDKIPTEGPIVFVANHPFGIIDGGIICHLVAQKRKDFFLPVNEAIAKDPILKDHLLPVDFRKNKEGIQINQKTKEQITERLKDGKALIIFPAGVVSTAKFVCGKVRDLRWRSFISSPIHETKCTVVPIYFHGRNSLLFQFASLITMKLRKALLVHEALNKRGKTIKVEIGNPIPYSEMEKYKDRRGLIDFLRDRTMSLEKTER